MNKNPIVLLDACVLYPYYLRDFLIHPSFTSKLYHPRWTRLIQKEWARNLIKNSVSVDIKKVERIQTLMNLAIPDALIPENDFEHTISNLSLPDKDDAHVLAAAIGGNTEAIITFNIKDFPFSAVEKFGLKVINPDDFILFLCSVDIDGVLKALAAQTAIMQNPPRTVKEVVSVLKKCGLVETADLLGRFL